MTSQRVIHWFRQDLRLADNPGLRDAVSSGSLLPIYILDDENAGSRAMGAASRWWLHHSLHDLNESLGGHMSVYRGDARAIITRLCEKHSVKAVFWNRCYEPWRIRRDAELKEILQQREIEVHSRKASLLWEPWEALKKDGNPYRVFTPFYRKGCLNSTPVREPLPAPESISFARGDFGGLGVEELQLLPKIRWDESLQQHWQIGERGAQKRLRDFLESGLGDYREGRNFPARQKASRLSPHLHFGEISAHQVWHAATLSGDNENVDTFRSELGWREFAHSLLFHFPELPERNLQDKFDRFPWRASQSLLHSWQRGATGYPIVDAGMRELWQTGYMHNRVRMIVASFLVKNLLQDWRQGEAWFWDCLVDADLANNSASWQWVAGCGADAAPYFRIFNPVTQGEKFDAHGEYTRQFVPELRGLPDKYLFKPWQAPEKVLREAGVELGADYPHPVVDLKESRERALAAYQSLKNQSLKDDPR